MQTLRRQIRTVQISYRFLKWLQVEAWEERPASSSLASNHLLLHLLLLLLLGPSAVLSPISAIVQWTEQVEEVCSNDLEKVQRQVVEISDPFEAIGIDLHGVAEQSGLSKHANVRSWTEGEENNKINNQT